MSSFFFVIAPYLKFFLYSIVVGFLLPLVLFITTKLFVKLTGHYGSLLYGIWVLLFFVILVSLIAKNAGVGRNTFVISIALVLGLFGVLVYYRRGLLHRVLGYMLVIAFLAPAMFLWNCYSSLGSSEEPFASDVAVAKQNIPVFVLVFDELPLSVLLDVERKVDGLRYPHFARFAATSTWYRNASTTADATSLAIPAILTGNRPTATTAGFEAASTAAAYPRSLFTLLHATHNIFASETITRLCPDWVCTVEEARNISVFNQLYSASVDSAVLYLHLILPDVFLQHLPSINSNWGGFQGDSEQLNWDGLLFSEEQVNASFANISKAALNDVHYVHMNMPHHPWVHYATGKRYRPGYIGKDLNPLGIDWNYPNGHLWHLDGDALAVARQRQSLQIAYSDRLLGGFLDAIQESGHFDDALIVVTADHGSNIEAGELFRWANVANVYDLMSIPLMVKFPLQAQSEINDLNAESIDVLPTVVDVLGVAHSWSMDGHSLRDLKRKLEKSKTILRTVPSTSTDDNKAMPRQLTLSDSNIFEKIWRDDFASQLDRQQGMYLFDRSYDPGWLGVSIESLSQVEGSRVVKMQRIYRFSYVDLSDDFLRGYLHLEIPKLYEDEEFMVAIALNGTIHVTRYISAKNSGEIEAILPEKAFVSGENSLQIFISQNRGSETVFEKLSVCSANGKNGPPICTPGITP